MYVKNKPIDRNLLGRAGRHLYGRGFEKNDIDYALSKIFNGELLDGELIEEGLADCEFGSDAD
jgi:hypothetical protein